VTKTANVRLVYTLRTVGPSCDQTVKDNVNNAYALMMVFTRTGDELRVTSGSAVLTGTYNAATGAFSATSSAPRPTSPGSQTIHEIHGIITGTTITSGSMTTYGVDPCQIVSEFVPSGIPDLQSTLSQPLN